MSRQHSRTFISLKQDRAGYGFKGKEPSGRCVIEAKNGVSKLTVYIQDIKPEIVYKAYIISSEHSQSEGLQVGTLIIDAKGKGELKWEFDADNVCGAGKAIEAFNIFALIIPSSSEMIVPLYGYRETDTSAMPIMSWKNNFTEYSPGSKENSGKQAMAEPSPVRDINAVVDTTVRQFSTADDFFKPAISPGNDAMTLTHIGDELEENDIMIIAEEECELENAGVEEVEDIEVELQESEIKEIESVEVEKLEDMKAVMQETEIQEAEVQEAEVQETEAQEAEAQEAEIQEAEIQEAEIQEAEIQEAEIQEAEVQEAEAQEAEIQEAEAQEAEAQETEVQEAEVQEAEIQETEVQITEAQTQEADAVEMQAAQEPEQPKDIHAAFLEMAVNFNKELKELEQITFVDPNDTDGVRASNKESAADRNVKEPEAVLPSSDGISEMFVNNVSMRPFQQQNIDVDWVRISMRELVFLPLDHWKYMNHPLFISAYSRFRHLILGRYDEDGEYRYFLGVPEIYDNEYKKRAMSLGFTQFKCCENIRAANGEYGYWIMPLEI